jgi:hypothetical protein
MQAPYDLATLLCAISYVAFALYALILWTYAAIRMRQAFFYLFVFGSAIGLVVSLVNVLLYANPHIGVRFLGLRGWKLFYYLFISSQVFESVMVLMGSTMLVRWLIRAALPSRGDAHRAGERGTV